MNEADLRSALKEEAAEFRPAPEWLEGVARRAAAVKTRNALAPIAILTAAAVAGLLVVVRPLDSAPPPSIVSHPVYLHLGGYQAPVDRHVPYPLRDHLDCMRSHGFDLPDPVWTGHGWVITVEDARSVGIGTLRWKRTLFLTCALRARSGSPPPEIKDAILHPRPRHSGGTP